MYEGSFFNPLLKQATSVTLKIIQENHTQEGSPKACLKYLESRPTDCVEFLAEAALTVHFNHPSLLLFVAVAV
jgi:hypothetical protein